MHFPHRRSFLALVALSIFLLIPVVNAVGFFSLDWSYLAFYQISPHALDSFGQLVYFGSSKATDPTNFFYALDILGGGLIWQFNASLPVNYVSHFNFSGGLCVVAGTGGSTASGLLQKSYVLARTPNNMTLWQSINLVSSVKSLGAAESYVFAGEDVVAGLENGTLLRLRGDNGSILWRYNCVGEVFSISELKNGSIVVGSRESYNKGRVYCFEKNGALRWDLPQLNRITLAKKFTDVNGDGEPEVVAVFYDNKIHVLNGSNGNELSPTWPFNMYPDNVKDLLCSEDYTGDGFPDIICGTEDGNLTIINGLNAERFRGSAQIGYTVTFMQYMYFYENGIAYSNKTLAVSLLDSTFTPHIYGVNASDLTIMKQFLVPGGFSAQNLFNIGNYTSIFTGDLIFTADNVVYNISGTEIIYSEFPSQIVLVILIVAVWFLMVAPRRECLRIF